MHMILRDMLIGCNWIVMVDCGAIENWLHREKVIQILTAMQA